MKARRPGGRQQLSVEKGWVEDRPFAMTPQRRKQPITGWPVEPGADPLWSVKEGALRSVIPLDPPRSRP